MPKEQPPMDTDMGPDVEPKWKPGIHSIPKGHDDPEAKPIPTNKMIKKAKAGIMTVKNKQKNKHSYSVEWS